MISKETIERVFEAARVEEVIGEFVQLKKSGSNFKGLSPFTDENTPSFMVSPVKQIWKDFSTGKGGSAVSFIMEHEHFSYPEAIKWLAKKYNIEIEETQQTDQQKQKSSERESMFLVSKFAKDYFHEVLTSTQKGRAIGLSYLKERGFRDEIIDKFDLGYCMDEWANFTNAALSKGYDIKYLKSTGLTIVKEGGEAERRFDRFKGRVMFPIHSMSGRILGFGGRILTNDKKAAKYLNSPESEIYHKSKILYGIYQAKKEIAKLDNCYLVEGYTDVISFYQSGIQNVVASSGTALTPDQIRLVHRLTPNITVLYDGDAAGIRASLRGIDLILEQGMNVKVVAFPEGEDPDSFAKSNSDATLKKYLKDNQQDFITFKVSLLMDDAKDDPIKKANLIRDIVSSIARIPDAIKREVYVQQCAKIMSISERVLFSELAQLINKGIDQESKNKQQKVPSMTAVKETEPTIDSLFILEKELIRILILYGNTEVSFTEVMLTSDDQGKEVLKEFTTVKKVADKIYLNLQEDEIEFTNEVFKVVYTNLMEQLNQNQSIDVRMFVASQNLEVANLTTSILIDDEKYTLSDWSRKDIVITPTETILPKLVTDVLANLRRVLIDLKIKSMLKEMQDEQMAPDLELIHNYIGLKKRLFDSLNRVL